MSTAPRLLSISELAREAGLSISGIRWWIDRGVIHPTLTPLGRLFTEGDLELIQAARAQRGTPHEAA